MALLEIRTYPDPVLREKCTPVDDVTDEIRSLLSDMAETMYDAPGIGLAAPQIGITKRLLVVDVGEEEERKLYKVINPEIVATSGEVEYEEGCLSLPGICEKVTRPAEATIKALNENGEEITIEATGLLAICLQHEIDHLDGVLIFDHISRLKRGLVLSKLKKLKK
jgi:peptide deformylase